MCARTLGHLRWLKVARLHNLTVSSMLFVQAAVSLTIYLHTACVPNQCWRCVHANFVYMYAHMWTMMILTVYFQVVVS